MNLSRRAVLAAATASVATPFVSRMAHANDLGQLVGPLLMLGFAGANADAPDAPFLSRALGARQIGGVCFLGHNVKSRAGVEALTRMFRSASSQHLALISVDQEGGAVQRLSAKTGYSDTPGAAQVASTKSVAEATAIYQQMAKMVHGAGFTLNLAPVVDLGFEKRNPIISKYNRAFGNDGATVARFAGAFCQGHRNVGLLSTLKHFPGHGSTVVDSHKSHVDLTPTWREDELEPYRKLVAAGLVDVVMSGHLSHARMGGADTPATLSRVAIEEVLRGTCHWQGVVMTDDVDMAAIRNQYQPADAAVAAIAAGNDLILMSNTAAPDNQLPQRVVSAVRKALADGSLKMSRIESAHARVTALAARAT